jgi:hypothetical protein
VQMYPKQNEALSSPNFLRFRTLDPPMASSRNQARRSSPNTDTFICSAQGAEIFAYLGHYYEHAGDMVRGMYP